MTAVADSIAPELERMQQQLLVAGDVRLSKAMARMLKSWRAARVEEAKREAELRAEAAKAIAVDGDAALTVVLPIHTFNELNQRMHWGKKQRVMGDIRPVVRMAMEANANSRGLRIRPPCRVRLTRLAPTELDAHDGMPASLKKPLDGVADWLGVDDSNPAVQWEYGPQEKARTFGLRVEVFV